MCFFSKQSKSAQELEHRFNAKFEQAALYKSSIYNGFLFPKTPIITNTAFNKIQMFHWGLIPSWAKYDTIKKYALNARIETIREKPTFKNSINNRCLILADGFFEWQWLDKSGKKNKNIY